MLDALANVKATVYGISAKAEIAQRTPTLCFNLSGLAPAKVTEELAKRDIGVRDGHMYSPRLMKRFRAYQGEWRRPGISCALQHRRRSSPVRECAG